MQGERRLDYRSNQARRRRYRRFFLDREGRPAPHARRTVDRLVGRGKGNVRAVGFA